MHSFNPRTYMRCDEETRAKRYINDMFQSTHLHEVRLPAHSDKQQKWEFQSTHLHEVRHKAWFDLFNPQSFNPRTYMRCDITKRG